MHRNVTISTIAAIGFALAACGSADRNESSASDNAAMANDMGALDNNMTGADAMAPQTAADFAAAAGASDMFEIESAKLAKAQASDAKVKDFAAMMVRDHTKSTADLKAIAAKENMTLAPPTLSADMQSKLDALKMTKGGEFDALYLNQQVPAHEAALTLMRDYAATGDNAAVKDFASKVAPVVQKHLDEAKALAK